MLKAELKWISFKLKFFPQLFCLLVKQPFMRYHFTNPCNFQSNNKAKISITNDSTKF